MYWLKCTCCCQSRVQAVRSASDQLLTAEEAAELLRVSKDFLYRRKKWTTLPFTVVLSERKILFSRNGILKYLEEKQRARKSV